jgi:nitrite reductase (cytochrome c-552)
MVKDTCLRCHPDWTEQQAEYRIDAIQAYTRGKIRKAEFSLGELVHTYALAKDLGVGEDVFKEVRKEHDRASILWEWWTAENSDGFHNPEQARQSLAESVDASLRGIEMLNKAISQKIAPQ